MNLNKLYKKIIEERENVSWLTGLFINNPSPMNCAHVVAKGTPEFKKYCTEDEDNIILLTSHEHHLLDHGTIEKRNMYSEACKENGIECDWNRIYELKEKLIEKYKNLRIINNDKKY